MTLSACGSDGADVAAVDAPDPAITAPGMPGEQGDAGGTGGTGGTGGAGAPADLRAACNGDTVYDSPYGLGFPTIAEAVIRSRTKVTPQSFTVRYLDRDQALVRERVGDRLTVYRVSRDQFGWSAGGDEFGPVGCAPLEEEFARPGKTLPRTIPSYKQAARQP